MRKRIYEIIEVGNGDDTVSKIYDVGMMIIIVLSILPLMTRTVNNVIIILDRVTLIIFIIDYILRLITADFKLNKGIKSYVLYPFTPMAIIDLISILPGLSILHRGFKVLKVARLFRSFRVFRVFKAFRYSKNIALIANVFKKQKESLIVVCCLAVGYVFITAIIMFNVEPDTFPVFFDAIYWATVSLTTVGYGDLYAVSTVGRIITMISSVFGVGIIALPAGIITAGYMEELKYSREDKIDDVK